MHFLMILICSCLPAQSDVQRQPSLATPSLMPSALNRRISDINYSGLDLEKALDDLAQRGRINIVVDWPALRTCRVFADTPITLSLKEIPLARVIDLVLELACGRPDLLGRTLEEGILKITSLDRLDSVFQTRVYSIKPLLGGSLSDAEQLELRRAVSQLWLRNFHVFVPYWDRTPEEDRTKGPLLGARQDTEHILDLLQSRLRPRILKDLLRTICNTVAPRTWIVHGGGGSIEVIDDRLIIRQSLRVHDEVERLLAQLQAGRSDTISAP